jgi:DNA modification methylase
VNAAVISLDGAIHFVCMDWRHMRETLAAGQSIYSELKNLCVWNKDNGGMGSFYRSKHELVFVFKVGTAPHINTIELGHSGRYRTNVWDYAGVNTLRPGRLDDLAMHPTVKPVALVADAIKDCSRRGDIVFDPFVGSGTTIISAQKSRRVARAIEIDPAYVDVAVRRWQTLTGSDAIHAINTRTFNDITANGSEALHQATDNNVQEKGQ